MKWIHTIAFCLFSMFAISQVYHETKHGNACILSTDSTAVLVEFPLEDFVDVTSDYQHMKGLQSKKCYKYGWEVKKRDRIDHKGLFVVKRDDGEIYSVWYYEDTEDGRGRLSKLLQKTFDY